jgi:hypothetical protein
MGTRLVTIATFDQAAQARLAQNALREAGIQAAVSDETLIAMDWLLSNAVGGVKVQVREEDAERAVGVLELEFGANGDGLGPGGVAPEVLAAAAVSTPPETGEHDRPEPAADPSEPTSIPAVTPGSREDDARRMVFTAVLGLVFPPVAGYALYLFLNAAFGEGELSERGRYNLWVGGLMTLAGLAWFPIFLWAILDP